MNKIII